MGSSGQQQIINQIVSSSTNPYNFGGLFTVALSTTIKVLQLISDSYQTHNTNYMVASGYLIGLSNLQSTITIMNVCLSINGIQQQVQQFGIIGYAKGNVQLSQISLTLSLQSTYFLQVGIIGLIESSSMLTQVSQVKSTTNLILMGSSSYGDIGTFGGSVPQQFLIINSVFAYNNNNNNYSTVSSGGISGFMNNCVIKVLNTVIQNSNIQSQNYCGGLFGTITSSNIYINSAKISQVHITSISLSYGIISGQSIANIYNIQQSQSIQIYFNNNLQTDCLNLINTWSVTQC
ncbi:Hypothetical_protein [Hexamita inflata]|uniref:Hypothetical_protein n=1 Tax=Hexamita inflata TaxID=28002 RepID=A0AA86RG34_9EUKA|nr:Hypothetical protein HINF_LOCUS64775 [Hexamita inflata]